jgi:hypothetical protein
MGAEHGVSAMPLSNLKLLKFISNDRDRAKLPPSMELAMADNQVARWAGGSPLGVVARLVLVSILVGVILSALGLDPFDIIHSVERLIRTLWNMGFDAFRWLWRYFLLGAVIVIPIWILSRLLNAPRGH